MRTPLTFKPVLAIWMGFSLLSCSENLEQVYVSPTGNDKNNGSINAPVQSVHKALEIALGFRKKGKQGNIDVLLENGSYFLDSTLVFNPQHDSITLKRKDPKGEVVISGGKALKNWKEESGLWVADLPKGIYFEQLWVAGKKAVRSRTPNAADLPSQWSLSSAEVTMFEKENIPEAISIYLDTSYLHGFSSIENIETVIFKDWAIYRKQVDEIDEQSGEIRLAPPFHFAKVSLGGHNTLTTPERVSGFTCYFEGSKSFIDQSGEWAIDRTAQKVYFKPSENQEIEKFTATYPFVEKLIWIEGSKEKPIKNLMFEGLTFSHSKYILPEKGHDGAQAVMFYGNTGTIGKYAYEWIPEAITCAYAKACNFTNCKFINLGASGVKFSEGSNSNKVENAVFKDIGGNAMMVGLKVDFPDDTLRLVKDNTIKNSNISYAGQHYPSGVGIWVGYANNTLIEGNHIHNLPYSGISNGWQWDKELSTAGGNKIINNHIHDVMLQLGDGGGIYVLGNQPSSEISGNEVHDIHRSKYNHGAPNNGLYFDEGSKNYIAKNNTVYNISHAPVRGHRPAGVWLINNKLTPHDSISPVFVSPPYENQILVYENDTIYWEKPTWLDKNYDSLQLGFYMEGNTFK